MTIVLRRTNAYATMALTSYFKILKKRKTQYNLRLRLLIVDSHAYNNVNVF